MLVVDFEGIPGFSGFSRERQHPRSLCTRGWSRLRLVRNLKVRKLGVSAVCHSFKLCKGGTNIDCRILVGQVRQEYDNIFSAIRNAAKFANYADDRESLGLSITGKGRVEASSRPTLRLQSMTLVVQ